MKCSICNTDNKLKECNHYGLHKTEYLIELHERDIIIRDSSKCYIPMFKYYGSYWCFALPIKSMYLMTIKQAKECIEEMKNDTKTNMYQCSFKIAQIKRPS